MTRWSLLAISMVCAVAVGCAGHDGEQAVATPHDSAVVVGDADRPGADTPSELSAPDDPARALHGRRLDGGQVDVLALEPPLALWMWAPW